MYQYSKQRMAMPAVAVHGCTPTAHPPAGLAAVLLTAVSPPNSSTSALEGRPGWKGRAAMAAAARGPGEWLSDPLTLSSGSQ